MKPLVFVVMIATFYLIQAISNSATVDATGTCTGVEEVYYEDGNIAINCTCTQLNGACTKEYSPLCDLGGNSYSNPCKVCVKVAELKNNGTTTFPKIAHNLDCLENSSPAR